MKFRVANVNQLRYASVSICLKENLLELQTDTAIGRTDSAAQIDIDGAEMQHHEATEIETTFTPIGHIAVVDFTTADAIV